MTVTIRALNNLEWFDQANGIINMTVVEGSGKQPYRFTYVPTDTSEVTLAIKAYLAAHSLPVGKGGNLPPDNARSRLQAFANDPQRMQIINLLKSATPAEVDDWVSNSVNTLAQARAVLSALIKVLAFVVRQ